MARCLVIGLVAAAGHALTFRPGRMADTVPIAAAMATNLMNPLSIRAERFEVATGPDDERLGWGQLRPLGDDGLWELASVFVVPERRGEGIGSAVVRRLLATHAAAGRRVEDVYLLTLARTRPWYEALGFGDAGDVPDALALEAAAGRAVTFALGEELVVLRGAAADPPP